MPDIQFVPIDSETVAALRRGGGDAYGNPAEHAVSDGQGNPCRHCLQNIPAGAGMLILAHRPFDTLQPYAETGPVFLCADACAAWSGDGVPPILQSSPDYLVKGYTKDACIRYGTGRIVAADAIGDYARDLLGKTDIAFVDVRSARNNCFQLRIRRTA